MSNENPPPQADPVQKAVDPREELAAAERAAASKAVRSIPPTVKKLGGSDEQASALAEAMRLVLLGYDEEVRAALIQGGYPHNAIDPIVTSLQSGLKPAA